MGINVVTVPSNENEIIWAVNGTPYTQYLPLFRREPYTNESFFSGSSVYERLYCLCSLALFGRGNLSATQALKFFQRKRLGRL